MSAVAAMDSREFFRRLRRLLEDKLVFIFSLTHPSLLIGGSVGPVIPLLSHVVDFCYTVHLSVLEGEICRKAS